MVPCIQKHSVGFCRIKCNGIHSQYLDYIFIFCQGMFFPFCDRDFAFGFLFKDIQSPQLQLNKGGSWNSCLQKLSTQKPLLRVILPNKQLKRYFFLFNFQASGLARLQQSGWAGSCCSNNKASNLSDLQAQGSISLSHHIFSIWLDGGGLCLSQLLKALVDETFISIVPPHSLKREKQKHFSIFFWQLAISTQKRYTSFPLTLTHPKQVIDVI